MLAVDGIAGSMYTPSAFRTQARSTYAEDSVSAWFLWYLGSGRHERVESLYPTRKPRGLFPSVEGRSPASNRTVFLRVRLFRVRTNRLFATVILVVLKSEVLPVMLNSPLLWVRIRLFSGQTSRVDYGLSRCITDAMTGVACVLCAVQRAGATNAKSAVTIMSAELSTV